MPNLNHTPVIVMMASSGPGPGSGTGGRDARMDSTWQTNETGDDEREKAPRRESQLNPVAAEFTPAAFSNMTNFARPRSNVQSAPRFQSIDEGPVSPTTNLEEARAARRQSGLSYRSRDSVPGERAPRSHGESSSSGALSQRPRRKRRKNAGAGPNDGSARTAQSSRPSSGGAGDDESMRTAQSSRAVSIDARNDESLQTAQMSASQSLSDALGDDENLPSAPTIEGHSGQAVQQEPLPPPLIPPETAPQVVNESPPISPTANDPLMQAIRELAAPEAPAAPLPRPRYVAPTANEQLQAWHSHLVETYGLAGPPPPDTPQTPPPPSEPSSPPPEGSALPPRNSSEIDPYAYDSPWRDAALSPLPAPALVRPPRPARFIIGPSETPTTVSTPEVVTLARQLERVRERHQQTLEGQRLMHLQLGLIDISTVDPSPPPPQTMEQRGAMPAGRTPMPVIVDGRTDAQRSADPLPQMDWTPAEGGDPSGARRQMAVVEDSSSSAQREGDFVPDATQVSAEQRPTENQDIDIPMSDPIPRIDILERARDAQSNASSHSTSSHESNTEDPIIEEPQPEEPSFTTAFEPLPILIRGLLHPRQDPAPPLTAERGRRRDEHHRPTVFNLDPRAGSEEAVASSPERPSSRTQRRRRRWRRGESSHESDRSR